MSQIHLYEIVNEDLAGFRLDKALAILFPQYSRSQLQSWVEQGLTKVDQKVVTKSKAMVYPGQVIEIKATLAEKESWEGENIPLNIIYEDEQIIIINKPPGIVVHPGAGNPKSTLVNALLHHNKQLKTLPRAGLIHRLDKDTSGLLLVAKTLEAHTSLAKQMQDRSIHRLYHAIVKGHTDERGTIDQPLGRHTTQRTKMAVLRTGGKEAITHYTVLERFKAHTYVEVQLETGRTHQIRVHMAYIHHPVVGDPVYSKQVKNMHLDKIMTELLQNFPRQALHAKKLSFLHPSSQEICTFECPLPDDFQILLEALRKSS